VVAEVSLTLVLMVGAGLLVRSLFAMQTADVGFPTRNVLTMTVPLSNSKYAEPADRIAFTDRLTESLRSLPDIDSFTIASQIPLAGTGQAFLKVAARDGSDATAPLMDFTSIGPGYFRRLGLTMLRGGAFWLRVGL